MARQNKIDELFRDELSSLEVMPSEQSWEKVNGQLKSNKSSWQGTMMKVAAIGLLLLAATVVLIQTSTEEKTLTTGNPDHPKPNNETQLVIQTPEHTARTPHAMKQKPNKVQQIAHTQPINAHQKTQVDKQTQHEFTFEALEVAKISNVELAVLNQADLPEMVKETEKVEIQNFEKVKITYIATEESTTAADGGIKITKVLSAAQKLSTAELLADLRDAKNQLLSKN